MSAPLRIKTAAETAAVDYNLGQMLAQPDGLEKIALTKLPPFIRETRDYESFGRKILVAHNVTSDQLQVIDNEPYVPFNKDLNARAAFMGPDGQVPRYHVEGEVVNVPILVLSSDDTTLNQFRLLWQRFNYLERTRKLAADAAVKAEDNRIIDTIELLLMGTGSTTAPENDSQIVTSANTSLAKNDLVELKKLVDGNDIPMGSFLLHPAILQDILKWGFGVAGSDIDQMTQREALENGVSSGYKLWGVPLFTSIIIPKDTVYAFAEKEYVGYMPILLDLNVRLTDRPNKLEKGLFMYEFIGFYLCNHKAVGKLIFGFSEGDAKIKFISNGANEAFGRQKDIVDNIKAMGSREGN